MNAPLVGLALGALLAAAPLSAQAREAAIDACLERLSLEEQAGQLFMPWILARAPADARARLCAQVRELGLGGVIVSLGDVQQAGALIGELQRSARVPLLIASDFETSAAARLSGATELGNAMLLGASGSALLARAAGRVTAREGRALGFHVAFAPVLDVNSNPANPIINVRSFGEDPALVARLGRAWIAGLQEGGMLATAKHFPGHGDVATDSHLVLPTLPGDRARLDRIELAPFRAAVDAGVAAIMTGHLAVPGLGEDPAVPATLSRRILTDVLRGELGFRGLIVTDALEMGGVRGGGESEDTAVRALRAGADLLLMPTDVRASRDAVVAAVRSGAVTPERFASAVRAVLRIKAAAGLLDGGAPAMPTFGWIGDAEHRSVGQAIAGRGLTLVRDGRGIVPLAARNRLGRCAVVSLLDEDVAGRGDTFVAETRRGFLRSDVHRLHPGSDAASLDAAAAAIGSQDLAIVALHVRVREYSGRLGVPPALAPVLEALRSAPRAIVVSFGSPYLLGALPADAACLCAFSEGWSIERAAAHALWGAAAITGRLPVSVPGVAASGAGLSWQPPAGALARGTAADEDLAADLEARIEALLDAAIAERVFPGAVALVTRRARIVARVFAGRETHDPDAPLVHAESLFDLASLTKVCATVPAVLRLVAAGKLALDTRVAELVEEFRGTDKERVTVRDLLAHAGGLAAHADFRALRGREAIVAAAARADLVAAPRTRETYSDLGAILLMACIERAAGEPFEAFVQREVFAPLGMERAAFARTGEPLDAVPTEDCPWRGRVIRGEAHDENAFAMGGVSGHAGLFATAADVARIGNAFLGGGRGWLPPALARQAVARAELIADGTRALGWDTFVPGGSGGALLSPAAFGHTGFTGTSIWCDPRSDLCIVLLTNRVHPTRAGDGIQRVRGALADLVVKSLER